MKRVATVLAVLCVWTGAAAQEAGCPPMPEAGRRAGLQSAPLLTGAIRVGPVEDRVELAGGDVQRLKGGYDILYRFPGHEIKWLLCAYGKDGNIQSFKRMREETTECRLQVRSEGKASARARMVCK